MKESFKKPLLIIILIGILGLWLCSCSPKPPKPFIAIEDSTGAQWKSIELRPGITYEQAWQILIDTLTNKWDIETMDKESGYIRTTWVFTTGKDKPTGMPFTYGRRITLKFSEDRKILRIKTEAFYQVTNFPTSYGMDGNFDSDAFTQISGKLGRGSR
jgi:hypothetical protein